MNQKKIIISLLNYLDNNLYKTITMEELSKVLYYNKDYLMRLFKKELGLTIIDYINIKKVYLSLNTLKKDNYTILKTSLIHGFSSQEYYSEIFKKIIGVNPITYRKFTKTNTSVDNESIFKIIINQANIKKILNNIENYKKGLQKDYIIALKKH